MIEDEGRLSVPVTGKNACHSKLNSSFFFSVRIDSLGQSHMTNSENNLKTLE